MPRSRSRLVIAAAAAAVLTAGAVATVATAPAGAATDSFFSYTGKVPLKLYKPGRVLKARTVPYHVAGIPTPIKAVQLLYRTTDQLGQPQANVTSILISPTATPGQAVSYQSFYDSLAPEDAPSRAVAGGSGLGTGFVDAETLLIAPFLLTGHSVIVTDDEGPNGDFAAGPEYGRVTLDGIRAASSYAPLNIGRTGKIGMIGYSGGAIATTWAAALAPTYAPDVNKQLVAAASGGILVDPDHNLHYIDGSLVWAGVQAMALIGVARADHIDLRPYLNAKGLELFQKLQYASIDQVIGQYPGLTFASLTKPQYSTPESIPAFVKAANGVNLGSAPAPTVPTFLGQGTNGILEGTPGLGAGDGVMVAGDVRALAKQYCAAGTPLTYRQYDLTSHVTTVPLWAPEAVTFVVNRLSGAPVGPSNCDSIPPGNSLAPLK